MSILLSKSRPSMQLISLAFMLLRRLARIERGPLNRNTDEAKSYVEDMINALPPLAVTYAQQALDTEELARDKAESMESEGRQAARDRIAEQALDELNDLLRWREELDEAPWGARTANRPEDGAMLTACEQAMYERSMAFPDCDVPPVQEPKHEPSWQLLSAAQAQIAELTTRVDALAALAESRGHALHAVGQERDNLDVESCYQRRTIADLLAKQGELREALRTCKEALRIVTKELDETINKDTQFVSFRREESRHDGE